MDVAITELEKIEADRIDGVGQPANGIPILLLKQVAEPVEKDWASWDAAHEGGRPKAGKAPAKGDSKADASAAFQEARQTLADKKDGKKPTKAELENAHDVHEAHVEHEEHEAKLKAESKKGLAKGQRDCPECDKSYDADHQGGKCENCGAKLPVVEKAADQVDCPTCKGDGKIMGDKRDCPDCDNGKVTPAKAKTLAAKALVKAVVGRGKVDESPDIAGGTAVIAQIADLIIAEAQELKAGNTGEISDIFQLASAAEMIWSWRTGEEAVASGSVQPATALMQSAADVAKDRNYSTAERKEMAGDGRALPDGSYPINDAHDLASAAILARSGHGDVNAATRHIGKRAKELGVPNPLEESQDGAAKEIAKDVTVVENVTQDDGRIAKAVEDAVTKATAPLEERIKALSGELAKVKAMPIPGGPMMTAVTPRATADRDRAAKDAAYFRDQADMLTGDPAAADAYRQLARQAEEKAKAS